MVAMEAFLMYKLFLILFLIISSISCDVVVEVDAPECFSPQKMCFEGGLYECNDGKWEMEQDCLQSGQICILEFGITYCKAF